MTKRTHALCLIGLVLLASFLYFYKLGEESLLTDEYLSLHVAQQPLRDILFSYRSTVNPNTIPPLYEILLHYWLKIFGAGHYAQRSLSAVLGVLSILLLYKLAEALFDRRTGLLSALFGALSFNWFLHFRQNRAYSLFIMLTLLSFFLYFRYLKNNNQKGFFAGLVLANIAMVYTHYFGFIVVGLQVLFVFMQRKTHKAAVRDIVFMSLWAFGAFIPWGRNFFFDLNREPLIMSRPEVLLDAAGVMLDCAMILFYDFHIRWEPFLTALYLILMMRGAIVFRKEKSEIVRHRLSVLFLIVIIPSAVIYLATFSNRIRYYAPFYFPFAIFLALGAQKWELKKITRAVAFLSLFVPIAVFNVCDFYDFYHNPLNENWKRAAAYIKSVPGCRDKNMVFIFQTIYNPPVFAYYFWDDELGQKFANNIASRGSYEKDLSARGIKHKVYIMENVMRSEKDLFELLETFPEDALIWIFAYHRTPFSNFRVHNRGRYFFHSIELNHDIPQIDFFLLRKIK